MRSVAFQRDASLCEAVAGWMAEQPGVTSVVPTPGTGSLLVTYDASLTDAGQLLERVARRARLAIEQPEPHTPPTRRLFEAAEALDRQVLHWSGGRFGLRLAVPAAMGIGSVGSLLFSGHRRAPRWDNLMFWGFELLRALNEQPETTRQNRASSG